MERLEQSPRPLLRSAELTQLGYAAAGLDMNHAITQIDAIRDTPGVESVVIRAIMDSTAGEMMTVPSLVPIGASFRCAQDCALLNRRSTSVYCIARPPSTDKTWPVM